MELNQKLCYVCINFVEADHVCPTAKKLAEQKIELDGPYINAAALPTRRGVEQDPWVN